MLQIFLFIKLSPKYLREEISRWKIFSSVCGMIFHGEKPSRQSAGTYFMVKNLLDSLREHISWWKTSSIVCGKIFHGKKLPRQSAGIFREKTKAKQISVKLYSSRNILSKTQKSYFQRTYIPGINALLLNYCIVIPKTVTKIIWKWIKRWKMKSFFYFFWSF